MKHIRFIDTFSSERRGVDIQPLLDYAGIPPEHHHISITYIIVMVLLRLVQERTHG